MNGKDMHFVSHQFDIPLKTMGCYEKKLVVKALDYHQDINFDEKIDMIDGAYHWKNIEARLNKMTLHPKKLFDQSPEAKKEKEKPNQKKRDHRRGLGL